MGKRKREYEETAEGFWTANGKFVCKMRARNSRGTFFYRVQHLISLIFLILTPFGFSKITKENEMKNENNPEEREDATKAYFHFLVLNNVTQSIFVESQQRFDIVLFVFHSAEKRFENFEKKRC